MILDAICSSNVEPILTDREDNFDSYVRIKFSTSDVFVLSSIRTNFRSVSFRSVSLCPEQFWITFFGPKRGGDGSNVLPRPVD